MPANQSYEARIARQALQIRVGLRKDIILEAKLLGTLESTPKTWVRSQTPWSLFRSHLPKMIEQHFGHLKSKPEILGRLVPAVTRVVCRLAILAVEEGFAVARRGQNTATEQRLLAVQIQLTVALTLVAAHLSNAHTLELDREALKHL